MLHEDDQFHPNNIDGDEFDCLVREPSLYSETTIASTIDTRRKRFRQLGDDYKKMDKGYQKIKVFDGYKFVDVEFYSTSATPGVPIRDAITGAKNTEDRVGSRKEDLFFKTNWSVGQETHLLFFDSPEQFERHMRTTVLEATKQKWMEKCVAARVSSI
jgi:hypothetical protein